MKLGVTSSCSALCRVHVAAFVAAMAFTVPLVLAPAGATAQPYTIKVLASFNGTDGNSPDAGLIMDGKGDFYGTTMDGGATAG